MARGTRKLRPVTVSREADYPSFERYHAERRQVLRWLGAGGAMAATAGLLGCDSVRDLLGLEGEERLVGEVACPNPPVAPVATGGETETETEAETETETETESESEAETEAETEAESEVVPTLETTRVEPPRLSGDMPGPEHPSATEATVPTRPARTKGKMPAVNPNPPKD